MRPVPAIGDEKARGEPGVRREAPPGSGPETLLKRVADTVPALLSYIDDQFIYRIANAQYERWFGRPRQGTVGQHVREVLGEEAWREVRPYMARALAGESVVYELPLPYRDGGRRWVRVTYTPDADEGGAVRGFVALVTEIAEQKRVEAALRRSEARLAGVAAELGDRVEELGGLLDLLPAGVFIGHDPRCADITANKLGAAMLGVGPGENPSKTGPGAGRLPFRVFRDGAEVAPEDLPMQRAARLNIEVLGEELDVVRSDGRTIRMWMFAKPLHSADGSVRGALGAFVDISERAAAEARLKESEAKFRKVYEANAVGLALTDAAGRVYEANESLLATIGYTREDVAAGRVNWRDLTPPEHLPLDEAAIEMILREGRNPPFEKEFIRKDGSRVPVLVGAVLLGGDPPVGLSTIVDLSRLRAAERAISESEERFRTLVDASSALMWVNGPDGGCETVNRAYLDFFGKTLEEVRGFRWVPALHPDDGAAYMEGYVRAFQERRPYLAQTRIRRADGVYRWFLCESRPRFGDSGAFLGLVGSAVDVTEVVEAREFLQRRQEEMQELVRARTAELESSYARLRTSERMATIGTLSAGLGHDIGNLLLPIRERLDALRERACDAESRDDLNAISKYMDYFGRMTQGLRLLAMDPNERTGLEVTELHEWWGQAELVLKNALPVGATLGTRLPAGPIRVRLGRVALSQAAFNLVQNAGDALRGRTDGRVTLWAEAVPGRSEVMIGVTDNGPGMSDEVRRRCLEPFFTTKTRGLSTGLGLALVHGIVQRAGGLVAVESSPGAGSTFTITLPAAGMTAEGLGEPVAAAVSLTDARLASFVVSLLGEMGVQAAAVGEGGPAAHTERRVRVWVADASAQSLAAAAEFVEGDPGRRVVLVGAADAAAAGGGPGIAVSPARPAALRGALAEAAAAVHCGARPVA